MRAACIQYRNMRVIIVVVIVVGGIQAESSVGPVIVDHIIDGWRWWRRRLHDRQLITITRGLVVNAVETARRTRIQIQTQIACNFRNSVVVLELANLKDMI